MARPVEILLADADVLIDYRDADPTILKLVSEHIGPVRVLREVLDEVERFGTRDCARLGIELVQLETESMLRVNTLPRSLSLADRLCVIACEERGWTCVTNDRTMRRVCQQHGVRIRWGLGLMIDLVRSGALAATRALKIAEEIGANNPTHIGADVIERFREAIITTRRGPR